MNTKRRLACWSVILASLLVSETTSAQEGSWAATVLAGAPMARSSHTAVWTGSRMIVWGGTNFDNSLITHLNTGAAYDPTTETWTPSSTVNAPSGRVEHTAVWTGSRMIVWGGYRPSEHLSTGAAYDPATNTWTATSTVNAPSGRADHTAVWTGSRMIVWGGHGPSGELSTGAVYDPATNTWTPTSAVNAPSGRSGHTAVWTGSSMVVWGGDGPSGRLSTGAAYDPATDTWTPTSTVDAPSERAYHTAVWTGSSMIVWGGSGPGSQNDLTTGAAYDAATGTWTPTSSVNAPSERPGHTAVWTGSNMIIWGGVGPGYVTPPSGAVFHPATNTWTPTSTVSAPPRPWSGHSAVRAGSSMIVWGGVMGASFYLNTGGIYTLPALLPTHQSFYSVPPCRVLDTRQPDGPLGGPALGANMNRDFVVAGHCGIPSTARTLSVNLTATGQSAQGHLRLYPGGTLPPQTSSLNYDAGQTRANNAIVVLGATGDIGVRCAQGSGTAHLIIDVNGYYE